MVKAYYIIGVMKSGKIEEMGSYERLMSEKRLVIWTRCGQGVGGRRQIKRNFLPTMEPCRPPYPRLHSVLFWQFFPYKNPLHWNFPFCPKQPYQFNCCGPRREFSGRYFDCRQSPWLRSDVRPIRLWAAFFWFLQIERNRLSGFILTEFFKSGNSSTTSLGINGLFLSWIWFFFIL